jgi:hypothetical protein
MLWATDCCLISDLHCIVLTFGVALFGVAFDVGAASPGCVLMCSPGSTTEFLLYTTAAHAQPNIASTGVAALGHGTMDFTCVVHGSWYNCVLKGRYWLRVTLLRCQICSLVRGTLCIAGLHNQLVYNTSYCSATVACIFPGTAFIQRIHAACQGYKEFSAQPSELLTICRCNCFQLVRPAVHIILGGSPNPGQSCPADLQQ